MKKLLEKFTDSFDMASPATPLAIEEAEKNFNLTLPTDYKEFLLITNGLEGDTKGNYLVLWSAEELIQLNKAYNVSEFVSNIIIIGSDGAEDAIAFDSISMSIVKLPFIGMGHIETEKISNTFEEFLFSFLNKSPL